MGLEGILFRKLFFTYILLAFALVLFPKAAYSADYNLTGEVLAEKNSILLSWENPDKAESFEIERSLKDKNSWEKLGTSKGNKYLDFYFQPETAYSYRIRQFGASEYSKLLDITTPKFEPNVERAEAWVNDVSEVLFLAFPEKNTRDPLYVLVENRMESPSLAKNKKLISNIYEIKIKDSKGKKVTTLDSQITLTINYAVLSTKGTKEETIKLITSDGSQTQVVPASQNQTRKQLTTLTNSVSSPVFYLVADRISPWVTVIKVFLLALLVLGIGFGVFVAYRSYQLRQYQKEHQDDFIYRH